MRIQNDSKRWTDKTAKISVKSCTEFEKANVQEVQNNMDVSVAKFGIS